MVGSSRGSAATEPNNLRRNSELWRDNCFELALLSVSRFSCLFYCSLYTELGAWRKVAAFSLRAARATAQAVLLLPRGRHLLSSDYSGIEHHAPRSSPHTPSRPPLNIHGEEHIIHSGKKVRRQPHPPFTLLLRAWKMLGRCLVIGERLCYALRSAEYVLVLRNLEHQMRDAIST